VAGHYLCLYHALTNATIATSSTRLRAGHERDMHTWGSRIYGHMSQRAANLAAALLDICLRKRLYT
jgi:hypothetical protein